MDFIEISYDLIDKSYDFDIIYLRRNMEITLTELKENLGKYVVLSQKEDILVTKNGKIVSRLTEPFSVRKEKMEKKRIARKLVGSIKVDYVSLDDIRAERLGKK